MKVFDARIQPTMIATMSDLGRVARSAPRNRPVILSVPALFRGPVIGDNVVQCLHFYKSARL